MVESLKIFCSSFSCPSHFLKGQQIHSARLVALCRWRGYLLCFSIYSLITEHILLDWGLGSPQCNPCFCVFSCFWQQILFEFVWEHPKKKNRDVPLFQTRRSTHLMRVYFTKPFDLNKRRHSCAESCTSATTAKIPLTMQHSCVEYASRNFSNTKTFT